MLSVKVLGPGCSNCQKVEAEAKAAVDALGVTAEFEKVTDYDEMARYNILATPGLVINEKLVAAGRIPSRDEIMVWLNRALAPA